MPAEVIAALAGFAFLGAVVFGITGFGATLVTIPFATHLVAQPIALGLFSISDLVCALILGVQNARKADHAEWVRLIPTMLVGTALGVTLLINLPRAAGMLLLGAFVASFAIYNLGKKPSTTSVSRRWAVVAGFFGGIASALFGAGGPVYAAYLSQRGLSAEHFRATMGFVMMAAISVRFVAFLISGVILEPAVLFAAAFVTPASVLGLFVGRAFVRKVSRDVLMRIVLFVLIGSGASLIYRGAMLALAAGA